jgi:hypothetical protein
VVQSGFLNYSATPRKEKYPMDTKEREPHGDTTAGKNKEKKSDAYQG